MSDPLTRFVFSATGLKGETGVLSSRLLLENKLMLFCVDAFCLNNVVNLMYLLFSVFPPES